MKLTHKTNPELVMSSCMRSAEDMHKQAADYCLCLGVTYDKSDFIEEYEFKEAEALSKELLRKSDWRAAKASDTGVPMSDEWKKYRQDLRDIINAGNGGVINWPTEPS